MGLKQLDIELPIAICLADALVRCLKSFAIDFGNLIPLQRDWKRIVAEKIRISNPAHGGIRISDFPVSDKWIRYDHFDNISFCQFRIQNLRDGALGVKTNVTISRIIDEEG